MLEEELAVAAGAAKCEPNAHTIVYTQTLAHPRLKWLTRRLELYSGEPRARLTVRFYRTESELPELFFVATTLPCADSLPETSNGGLTFVPYEDQLPGTCREYFSIDSWTHYQTPAGRWLWVTRDASLVTFGNSQVLTRVTTPPATRQRKRIVSGSHPLTMPIMVVAQAANRPTARGHGPVVGGFEGLFIVGALFSLQRILILRRLLLRILLR